MTLFVLPDSCRPAEAELFINPNAKRFACWSDRQSAVLSQEGFRLAKAVIHNWPGYQPTPLIELNSLASSLGIDRIWYKDEARRFDLKSFKALGGAYAIAQLILREAGKDAFRLPVSSPLLFAGKYRDLAADITVSTATDGNHGRSVAWGAKLFGCKAVIYIHATVSEGRKRAIEALALRSAALTATMTTAFANVLSMRSDMAGRSFRIPLIPAIRRSLWTSCRVMA